MVSHLLSNLENEEIIARVQKIIDAISFKTITSSMNGVNPLSGSYESASASVTIDADISDINHDDIMIANVCLSYLNRRAVLLSWYQTGLIKSTQYKEQSTLILDRSTKLLNQMAKSNG